MNNSFSNEQKKEFKEDGLSDEEIELIEDGLAFAETINMIPDDLDGFFEAYKTFVPDGTKEEFKTILEISNTHPEFLQQLIAMDIAISSDIKETESKNEDTFITRLPDDVYDKASKKFFETIANLKDGEKKEFFEMLLTITEDQKKDLIDRLTN